MSQAVLGTMPMAIKAPVTGRVESSPVLRLRNFRASSSDWPVNSVTTVSQMNLHHGHRKDAFLQVFAAPKLTPAVNQVDLFDKALQEKDLGEGVVTPAHHGDFLVFKKGAVTGGAEADPVADELVFSRDPQPPITGAGGDDDGAGRELAVLEDHRVHRFTGFQFQDFLAADFQAEAFRLFPHPVTELEAGDPLRESRVVLHQVGGHHLPAVDELFQEQGLEAGPAGIDARGQPGWAAANDDQVIIPRRHAGPVA